MNSQRIWRIGLTGGIGSGKSTVAGLLAARGAAVIDADAISRSVTAPGGRAISAIAATFGAHMVGADGAMDRQAMRERVFQDTQAKRQLEAIIHPLVSQITAEHRLSCEQIHEGPLSVTPLVRSDGGHHRGDGGGRSACLWNRARGPG